MQQQNRRTPITDAVYGRGPKRKPKPASRPRQEPRGTTLGDILDPATIWKLERLAAAAKPRRKGAK